MLNGEQLARLAKAVAERTRLRNERSGKRIALGNSHDVDPRAVAREQLVGAADKTDSEQIRKARLEDLRCETRADLQAIMIQNAHMHEFSRWLDNELGPERERRHRLEVLLADRLAGLKRDCLLSEAEVKRLELAGKDDINRLLNRLDALLKKINNPRTLIRAIASGETDALRIQFSRLFGDGSALEKALAETLSPQRRANYDQLIADRNLVRYRRSIHQAATAFARVMRMSEDQAAAFEDLLWKETRPPKSFGRYSSHEAANPEADTTFVLFQASRLPEANYKGRLSPAVGEKLVRGLAHWNTAFVEQSLKKHGYVFDPGQPAHAEPEVKLTPRTTIKRFNLGSEAIV
jgi:hypothetical protein